LSRPKAQNVWRTGEQNRRRTVRFGRKAVRIRKAGRKWERGSALSSFVRSDLGGNVILEHHFEFGHQNLSHPQAGGFLSRCQYQGGVGLKAQAQLA